MQLPGERLLIKLTEVLASGVGTATRAWFMRRDERAKALGKAEAKRIERLNQELLRQQLRDIRSGRKTIDSELRVIEAPTPNEAGKTELAQVRSDNVRALRETSASPGALIEMERRINLEQVSALVIEEANADHDNSSAPDDKPVDPDWFAQWRNRAQDVSSEDMQRLWARVLRGEAKTTGSYSIHTMEFLSRMSRSDAELIAKLGCFALDDAVVYNGGSRALETAGLALTQLLYLSDLGILSGVSGIGSLSWSTEFRDDPLGRIAVVRLKNKALMFKAKSADQKELSLPSYPISIIGRELLALALCNPNLDYLKDIADKMRANTESIVLCDVLPGDRPDQYRANVLGPI